MAKYYNHVFAFIKHSESFIAQSAIWSFDTRVIFAQCAVKSEIDIKNLRTPPPKGGGGGGGGGARCARP